jgi:hypothetical protein
MSPRQSEVHLKDGSDSSLQTRWTLLLNVAMDESAAVRRRLVWVLFPMSRRRSRRRPEVCPSDGSARSLPMRWRLVRYIVGNESATGRICVRGTAPPRRCRCNGYLQAIRPSRSDGPHRLVASDAMHTGPRRRER